MRLVFATDGACRFATHTNLKSAGAGVFYGTGHRRNASIPLHDYAANAQRAELRAFLRAATWAEKAREVLTYSSFVAKSWSKMIEAGGPNPGWNHQDLWEQQKTE